jgi:hypothetical protein
MNVRSKRMTTASAGASSSQRPGSPAGMISISPLVTTLVVVRPSRTQVARTGAPTCTLTQSWGQPTVSTTPAGNV